MGMGKAFAKINKLLYSARTETLKLNQLENSTIWSKICNIDSEKNSIGPKFWHTTIIARFIQVLHHHCICSIHSILNNPPLVWALQFSYNLLSLVSHTSIHTAFSFHLFLQNAHTTYISNYLSRDIVYTWMSIKVIVNNIIVSYFHY